MPDTFDKDTRSRVMKSVPSKGNKTTELRLISFFDKYKITGWRRNYPVKGHPDFIFPKRRIAVFADGCFWHGHDCRNTKPTNNKNFWDKKREYNKKHDQFITERFNERGWTVIRLWECEIKSETALKDKLASLII